MPDPTNDTDDLTIVRDQKLAKMLDVSSVTLWRMSNDPAVGLPAKVQISKGISGRRLSDLRVWFETRASR